MKILLVLTILLGVETAQAVPRILDADIVRGIKSVQNYVKNPEFETNIANVTDGGAGIISWSNASPVDNTGSLVINSFLSGEIVKIATKAQQKKLEGQTCVAEFSYSGNASNYKAYVLNGVSNVSGDFPLSNAGAAAVHKLIPYPCQSLNDTVDVAIESTAVTAGSIKVDSVFVGESEHALLPGFTAGSVLFSNGTKITEDNTNLFFNDASNYLTVKAGIELGSTDSFARPQIWNKLTNAVLRLGSWGQDGDAGNVSSEGIVVYSDSLTGQPISATDGGYARVKHNRFGLFTVDSTLPAYAGGDYYFRADNTSMYYKDNSAVKTFEVTRTSGNITTPGTYVGTGSITSKTSLVLEDPGAGTNTTTVQAATLAGSYTLTLPVDAGTANQVLATDGSGVLSWVNRVINTGDTMTGNLVMSNTGTASEVRFAEDTGNGANYAAIKAPSALAANYTLTLPADDGTAGQVLSTDGSGGLSWINAGSGSPILAVSTKTANYTLTTSDDVILCDTGSGGFTLTLPTAVGNTGKQFFIKKIAAANDCIIDANGAQTIDGELTQTLRSKQTSVTIVSDGSNWQIL